MEENLDFFDENHGLTPLKKSIFGLLKNYSFYSKKEFPFYLEHYFYALFALKK